MNSPCLIARDGQPQVLIDVPGVVGQFLTDLTPFDVVVEFIQNELDAGSTNTKITFGAEELICEGSGKPIDDTGWDRLRYVLGAGGDVAAKVGGIGAKNHGLRSAFLLGDIITVQSSSHRIDLTVRGDELNSSRFYPAVWPKIYDTTAPKNGTRITVPYRRKPLMVPNGDQTSLDVESPEKIATLFAEAVEYSPSRFIAASSPGRSWRYELTFAFADTISKLIYECEPLKGKYAGLFRRTCRLEESGRRARIILRQLGSAFELKLADNDCAKVPKLFQRGTRLLGEISWQIDRNDFPLPGCGGLRYPIGYPIEHVQSGYGFDISGPFISGRARHSLSDDARNKLIREAGCAAFVAIMRKKLIPLFGAKSMDLVSSQNFPDADAEKRLVNNLLVAGALPIAKSANKSKRGILKCAMMEISSNAIVTIASPSYEATRISTTLVRLATSAANLLHPAVHERVVATLHQMHRNGDKRVVLYNELVAAQAILVDQAPLAKQAATIDWIENVADVLAALETARHRVPLPTDFVQKLKTEGRLPNQAGLVVHWAQIRRSSKPVPAIPGVVEPNILYPRLSKLTLLKDGQLKISAFKLDDFVSNLDFSKTGDATCQRFFTWLRKTHSDLAPRALAKIACYPIWSGVDGKYRLLNDYCWPKLPDLRSLVHSVNIAPAEEVVSFPGLRRSHNGALRLRIKPSDTELRNWYVKQSETVLALLGAAQVQDAINTVSKIEKALDRLFQLEEYDIKVIAKGHHTFTRSGDYKPVVDIHCPTREIEHCGLLDCDVVGGIFTKIYALLGSHQKPTQSALVRALVSDTNQSLLFNRLEAYRSLGCDLADLSCEPIIIVRGQAMAPGTLTFPSSINWWGEWKIALEHFPDIPERASLLERTGVVRQALREELSRSFFDWISKQNKVRQKNHLPQIIRHWGEKRHGPSKWVQKTPAIPCIPVYGSVVDFELLSYEKATSGRSTIFLPDFREIQDKLIVDNPSTRLVIISIKGVMDSVLDVMREIGVPSLRAKTGRPIKILTSGGVVENDQQLEALLSLAQSKAVMKYLTHTLQEYDVPVSALRRDWRRRLEALAGTRVADRLSALYSVLKNEYEVESDGGVDELTQLLCIDRKADRKLAFYNSLAEHCFSENSSPLWAYGLLRAIESRYQPTIFDFNVDLNGASEGGEESEPDLEDRVTQAPPQKGHGLSPDRLEPAVPRPESLGDISDETKLSGKKRNPGTGNRSTASTDNRRHSIEEEEQILELKKNHYAWHCQACLGQYNAIIAAPPHSYVYLPSIRRKLIEAHHVQHLQNKGAIGAKNLVVLCTFHHDHFGDRLSTKAIKDALIIAQRVTKEFPSNAGGTTSIKQNGLLAEIKLDSAENSALLFFTLQHADAWTRTNN
ncbi:hypothetical protein B0F87_101641 [Methylobacter tundripaludum]|uniref:Uncharacterized protein n=2 Tax=Methylobacter tundripaludum TaxID=173365 RepID=A0A2S6HL88_9GAMM|nr:hypothetical protein B0F87_101641 [Methylobacter tundripaludum]